VLSGLRDLTRPLFAYEVLALSQLLAALAVGVEAPPPAAQCVEDALGSTTGALYRALGVQKKEKTHLFKSATLIYK
jgi:hypothetical protein